MNLSGAGAPLVGKCHNLLFWIGCFFAVMATECVSWIFLLSVYVSFAVISLLFCWFQHVMFRHGAVTRLWISLFNISVSFLPERAQLCDVFVRWWDVRRGTQTWKWWNDNALFDLLPDVFVLIMTAFCVFKIILWQVSANDVNKARTDYAKFSKEWGHYCYDCFIIIKKRVP